MPTLNPVEDDVLVPNKHELSSANDASLLFLSRAMWMRDRHIRAAKTNYAASAYDMPKVFVRVTNAKEKVRCGVEFSRRSAGVIRDICHPRQLDLIRILQDQLYQEYSEKHLQIETNPTSNVYIGQFDGYLNHPVFRWDESALMRGTDHDSDSDVRKQMALTVNTDDPGVMPTTLRLELALLGEAAKLLGRSDQEVQRWLANLRAVGMKEFTKKHEGTNMQNAQKLLL